MVFFEKSNNHVKVKDVILQINSKAKLFFFFFCALKSGFGFEKNSHVSITDLFFFFSLDITKFQ